MAIPAQGFSILWGGKQLAEVAEIEVDQARGAAVSRDGTWTLNLGTVRIAGFSTANIPESDYSKRRRLQVFCPPGDGPSESRRRVTIFDSDCLYVDRTVGVVVNDAVRFDFNFRVMDSKSAPT
jgi:hypothetical protein